MRYFYFTFLSSINGAPFYGNQTLTQHAGSQDDGFNFPQAHEFIFKTYGAPCVVTFWQEITEKRFFEWKNLVESKKSQAPVAPILSIVKTEPQHTQPPPSQ